MATVCSWSAEHRNYSSHHYRSLWNSNILPRAGQETFTPFFGHRLLSIYRMWRMPTTLHALATDPLASASGNRACGKDFVVVAMDGRSRRQMYPTTYTGISRKGPSGIVVTRHSGCVWVFRLCATFWNGSAVAPLLRVD